MRGRPRSRLVAILVSLSGCAPTADELPSADAPEPDGVYGQASPAVGGTPSVVSLHAPFVEVEPGASPVMDQFGLTFSPRRMVVRVGQEMLFKNSESLAHNVHLRSVEADSTILNVDTDPGGTYTFTFDAPGAYDVLCDLHPGMRGFIYASLASFTVIAADDGSFVVPDVPPGSYSLYMWSIDPESTQEREIEVGPGSTRVDYYPPR